LKNFLSPPIAAACLSCTVLISSADAEQPDRPVTYNCQDETVVEIDHALKRADITPNDELTYTVPEQYERDGSTFYQVEPQGEKCDRYCVELKPGTPATARVTFRGKVTECTAESKPPFPLKWACSNKADITIADSDGEMTLAAPGAAPLRIPFGAPMSSHMAWNAQHYSECEEVPGPCAIGGTSNDGSKYLSYRLSPGAPAIECKPSE
jgi:hypothetical protein